MSLSELLLLKIQKILIKYYLPYQKGLHVQAVLYQTPLGSLFFFKYEINKSPIIEKIAIKNPIKIKITGL